MMAASRVLCRSKVLFVIDFNRVCSLSCVGVSGLIHKKSLHRGPSGTCSVLSNRTCASFNSREVKVSWLRRPRQCRRLCSSRHSSPTVADASSPAEDALVKGAVTVEYYRGLPQITVPLPSRKENCRFTLKPISHTVGDFLEMLRHEDKGIDRVAITTKNNIRIASSNTIEALMEDDFILIINDKTYFVDTPRQEQLTKEELTRLSDVRNLIHQLYEALNVEEHQLHKERELCKQLEELKLELQPLEKQRQELEVLAARKTTILTWVGLGLMSVQFGILARLTWWEYSWDIMEPVTYFVTYGTAMAAYAYFVLTRQEYVLPDVKDRQHLIILHKRARKEKLNIVRYNELKDSIAKVETDLHRLRDPLQLHLPPHHLQNLVVEDRPKSALDTLRLLLHKKKSS